MNSFLDLPLALDNTETDFHFSGPSNPELVDGKDIEQAHHHDVFIHPDDLVEDSARMPACPMFLSDLPPRPIIADNLSPVHALGPVRLSIPNEAAFVVSFESGDKSVVRFVLPTVRGPRTFQITCSSVPLYKRGGSPTPSLGSQAQSIKSVTSAQSSTAPYHRETGGARSTQSKQKQRSKQTATPPPKRKQNKRWDKALRNRVAAQSDLGRFVGSVTNDSALSVGEVTVHDTPRPSSSRQHGPPQTTTLSQINTAQVVVGDGQLWGDVTM